MSIFNKILKKETNKPIGEVTKTNLPNLKTMERVGKSPSQLGQIAKGYSKPVPKTGQTLKRLIMK